MPHRTQLAKHATETKISPIVTLCWRPGAPGQNRVLPPSSSLGRHCSAPSLRSKLFVPQHRWPPPIPSFSLLLFPADTQNFVSEDLNVSPLLPVFGGHLLTARCFLGAFPYASHQLIRTRFEFKIRWDLSTSPPGSNCFARTRHKSDVDFPYSVRIPSDTWKCKKKYINIDERGPMF